MGTRQQATFWEQLRDTANVIAEWIEAHQDEIRAVGLWATVSVACSEARLYAPLNPDAWLEIADKTNVARDADDPDYAAIITAVYGPNGVGFEALRHELLRSPLLRSRRREVEEVLSSLAEKRNYVAICGALPLVEYVISSAAGKWNPPERHLADLKRRLVDDDFDDDDTLLLDYAAVQMVLEEIPNVWKSGRHQIGAVVEQLNRHFALHGTGIGWDDSANGIRAVLLLAAVARVANTLFRPPSSGNQTDLSPSQSEDPPQL